MSTTVVPTPGVSPGPGDILHSPRSRDLVSSPRATPVSCAHEKVTGTAFQRLLRELEREHAREVAAVRYAHEAELNALRSELHTLRASNEAAAAALAKKSATQSIPRLENLPKVPRDAPTSARSVDFPRLASPSGSDDGLLGGLASAGGARQAKGEVMTPRIVPGPVLTSAGPSKVPSTSQIQYASWTPLPSAASSAMHSRVVSPLRTDNPARIAATAASTGTPPPRSRQTVYLQKGPWPAAASYTAQPAAVAVVAGSSAVTAPAKVANPKSPAPPMVSSPPASSVAKLDARRESLRSPGPGPMLHSARSSKDVGAESEAASVAGDVSPAQSMRAVVQPGVPVMERSSAARRGASVNAREPKES